MEDISKILFKQLQRIGKNTIQMLDPQKTPHSSPWGVFYEYARENWPRYNDTALYVRNSSQLNSNPGALDISHKLMTRICVNSQKQFVH